MLQINSKEAPNNPITVGYVIEQYLKYIKRDRSPAYYRSVELSCSHLINHFSSEKLITSFTLQEIEDFFGRLKVNAPKGYHVYYRNIKATFNKAVEWGYLVKNPLKGYKPDKLQRGFPLYLSREELDEILLHVTNDRLKEIYLFAFYTGMRLGEITSLKMKCTNLREKIIVIGNNEFTTKSRKVRQVPMTDLVYEIVQLRVNNFPKNSYAEIQEYYLFGKSKKVPFTKNFISKSFKNAVKKTTLNQTLHFHSLRHSFASLLVQKGVSLYVVKELLGHENLITTQVYGHLNIKSLYKAVEFLN
ncbi:MAG: tyrosine-type recombinase/integrase [Melioribacteraceae bacterium]|nr:tyrosine-type recombinase/integrase [Melioribacteraceae bacterium]MCF8265238.1 tyrosine-type recombinase/integrase [Melioribacteraceae bacterium]MCF8413013.1 tyrosine-type recombinase/integrase [Melioribacteraceae bacterium]MCF8432714.1 tyrosine-type recombinase/integrase [Melioribacteraceae bacterium]